MDHALYVLRWIVLAIPGTLLLDCVASKLFKRGLGYKPALYIANITTQAALGYLVYWVDKAILSM